MTARHKKPTPPGGHRRRTRVVLFGIFAVLVASAVLLSAAIRPAHTTANTTPQAASLVLGVYKFGACSDCSPTRGVAGFDSYAQWLGSSQLLYAEDNIGNDEWDVFEKGWPGSFQQWGKWKAQNPARRLVLAVPFFVEETSGTYNERITSCAQGAYAAHYRALAQNLKQAGLGDSILRIAWEAHEDWANWSYRSNPWDWRDCWRHVALAVKSVAPTLRTDWNVGDDDGGNKTDMRDSVAIHGFDAFYPGNDVVDEIGIDSYPNPQVTNYDKLFNNDVGNLGWFVQISEKLGKPLAFPEWGLWDSKDVNRPDGSRDDPVYIERMHAWMTDPAHHVAWAAYFDVNVDPQTMHQLQPDWESGTVFPKASARFRQLFGS